MIGRREAWEAEQRRRAGGDDAELERLTAPPTAPDAQVASAPPVAAPVKPKGK